MDFAIDIEQGTGVGTMTWDKADTFMNNVYLSLMIQRGAFFQNPNFGSRLHLLSRAKNTAHTAALAEEYCKEALQWMLDTGRATKIEVFSDRRRLQEEDLNRLKLQVEVTQADGRQVSFAVFVPVV